MTRPRPAFPVLLSLVALLGVDLHAAHDPETVVGSSQTTLAPGPRYAPATATNGTEDFVVWLDQRSGDNVLLGTRVRDGVVLDPLGIVITDAAAGGPRVVFTGDSWLVTWNGSVEGVSQLMAARIARSGEILIPAKRVLAAATGTDLAVIGSRAVAVVWEDDTIHALVLDADANIIAKHPVAMRIVAYNGIIAAGATQFVMVWRDAHGTLEAVRLSSSGAVLDATPRPLGPGAAPAIASDGTGFALVAFDEETATWFTRRIAPDLSPGPAHPLIASENLLPPALIWTGSRYAALGIQEGRQLYVAFLDADGASPPPRILPWPDMSAFGPFLSVVARRGELAITSIRSLAAGDRHIVRMEHLNASTLEKQGPELALSWSGNEHSLPQIAFDGTNTLVVWREREGIFATRVTAEGQSLDGRGIELAGPSSTWYLRFPTAVFDGTQYIVAWTEPNADPGQIVIRFIDPVHGTPSDALTIRADPRAVSLTTGKDATLVTWNADRPMAARIDRASRTLSAPVTLATHMASAIRAAWNGTHFLVCWAELVPGPRFRLTPERIRGTRVTESLGILDPGPLVLGDHFMFAEHSPAIASNGDEWLVVWIAEMYPSELRARRIAADGTGIDDPWGIRLELEYPHLSTSLLWDGSRYVLASAAFKETRLLWLMPDLGFAGSSKVATTTVSLARTASGVTAAYTRPIWDAPYAGVHRTVLRHVAPPVRRRAVR